MRNVDVIIAPKEGHLMADFHGYPVQSISSKSLQIDCLTTAGPRIVGLRYKGSDNLLADVADAAVSTPLGEYRLLGGHRLWHAPESMPRSYIPDEQGMVVTDLPDGLIMEGPVEQGSGISKRIEIHLDADQPRATLTHTLSNHGMWPVELAPWAITMMRLGGVAILPHRSGDVPAASLLPDRHISFWPYTHFDDPRLQLHDDFILVRALPDRPPFKIGTFNSNGWTAYWHEGVLFRKVYAARPGLPHPDYGCNAEIYCDSRVIELESISPLSALAPGASVSHVESWELYDSLDAGFLSSKMTDLIRST